MKRMRLITALTLLLTLIAVAVATYNLFGLYRSEKAKTMDIVRECGANAYILEMISNMKSQWEAEESFIRLNAFVEMAQRKNGEISTDSLRTSLASLLRIGLEFDDNRRANESAVRDSILMKELHRQGLYPSFAKMLPEDSVFDEKHSYWSVNWATSSGAKSGYRVYVSPMPGEVLSHLWGIIVPFIVVIMLFAFLSWYLIRSVNRLRTIEEMKDDFTHNMTHELKTPVAVAYSAADSMLRYYDQSDEKRNKRFLQIILQRLSFLSGMIENILSMSMERFKTMQLNLESVSLRPVVEEAAAMIRLKTTKEVVFHIDIPEDLQVVADPLHLGNVLSNLLDNALKYSGEEVSISIQSDSDKLIIGDSGIGIAKENLPFIFDKFYRVASGNRYDVGGYGLGLYYVKQIVSLHSWEIDVESRIGKGTRFTIRFKGHEKR